MASINREENGQGDQPFGRHGGAGGQGQQTMEIVRNGRESGGPVAARSYKEMLEVLKQLNKSGDSLIERLCQLNMKYSDTITKAAILIDPEITSILHGNEENYPAVISQGEKMTPQELDKKFAAMDATLDQRLQQKEHNSLSIEMEVDVNNQASLPV